MGFLRLGGYMKSIKLIRSHVAHNGHEFDVFHRSSYTLLENICLALLGMFYSTGHPSMDTVGHTSLSDWRVWKESSPRCNTSKWLGPTLPSISQLRSVIFVPINRSSFSLGAK